MSYGVLHKEYAHQDGLQNFDAQCRADSRCPLDQPPGTMMETDGRRRRLILGMSKLAAPLLLMTS